MICKLTTEWQLHQLVRREFMCGIVHTTFLWMCHCMNQQEADDAHVF